MNVESGESSGTNDCDLAADLEYTLVVGAAAGATLWIGSHGWAMDGAPSLPQPFRFTLLPRPVHVQRARQQLTTIVQTSTGTPAGTTESSVSSTITFGPNVASVAATSGAPTAYSSHHSILDGTTNGTSNKLIIGLCVGLGVPCLAALAAGVWQA
ncbi:unnamed protein product [Penicillium pancosmium]